ncbi:expressed unknown protein [Seminavis robusta]|uniref:Uncharacterized protein n=1 Tax=Seminavis robusta TaxID=568900 RepID=A0A9N8HVN2_9STRA|nr:expressed unknown protein [Seminavis robusta]|eukprot:Sro2374_g325300.1 n/a (218) ;mRNA; f:2670-3323
MADMNTADPKREMCNNRCEDTTSFADLVDKQNPRLPLVPNLPDYCPSPSRMLTMRRCPLAPRKPKRSSNDAESTFPLKHPNMELQSNGAKRSNALVNMVCWKALSMETNCNESSNDHEMNVFPTIFAGQEDENKGVPSTLAVATGGAHAAMLSPLSSPSKLHDNSTSVLAATVFAGPPPPPRPMNFQDVMVFTPHEKEKRRPLPLGRGGDCLLLPTL